MIKIIISIVFLLLSLNLNAVRFRDVTGDTQLNRVLNVNSAQWRKGATAPTEAIIGTTPETIVFLFDAVNEVGGIYFNFPEDMDKTQDIRLDIDFSLVNVQINNDVLNITIDYVAITKNSTGSGLDKTSTQVLSTEAVTTANGLAVNDVYILQITISAGDGNNPLANATGISIDIHLTNISGVAAIHAIDGHLHYAAKY